MSNVITNINTMLKEEATQKNYNFLVVVTKAQRSGFLHDFNKEAYVEMQYQVKDLKTDKLSAIKSINNVSGEMVAQSIGFSFDNWEQATSNRFKFEQELINEKGGN
jgi:hypothetical protein|tara:strand:+ start:183 stop:500 length:318 start_codon:yes stop_codon:yes gene_type:complete